MIQILTLGPQEIWPPNDGGKEGIFGAITALAKKCTVTYACPCSEPSQETYEAFKKNRIQFLPVDYEVRETIFTVLEATLKLKPYKFHKYSNSKAISAFAKTVKHLRPDCIICHHAHLGEVGLAIRQRFNWEIPIIIREHNIEYELLDSYRTAQPYYMRVLLLPLQRITRRFEWRLWREVDAVAFLSDADYRTGNESGQVKRGLLAREGVPIPRRRNLGPKSDLNSIFYPFNPNASQNRFNLREFITKIWLEIRLDQEINEIKIVISGVNAEGLREITGLTVDQQNEARIEAVGFLDSLRATYDSALAVVSATFVGGGVRKKILEAMANEVPVIATELDIRTSSYYIESKNILKFHDADSFSKCLKRLKTDSNEWLQFSILGRKAVEEHANWNQYADVILDQILLLKK